MLPLATAADHRPTPTCPPRLQVIRSRLQQRMDPSRGVQYAGVLDVLRKTLAVSKGVGLWV